MIYWVYTHNELPLFKSFYTCMVDVYKELQDMMDSRPVELPDLPCFFKIEYYLKYSTVILNIDENMCPEYFSIYKEMEKWSWLEYYQRIHTKESTHG